MISPIPEQIKEHDVSQTNKYFLDINEDNVSGIGSTKEVS